MPVVPAWARFVAVASCGGCAFIDFYATQPLMPQLKADFGVGEAAVGATLTAVTVAVAIAAPFVGPISDRLGRKRVIVASLLLLALATLGAATARTLPQLIAWRFAQGAVTPGVFTATLAYIAEEFPAGMVGRVLGAYMTGNVIGGFSGRFIAATVAAHVSWQAVFVVLGVINVASAFLIALALPKALGFTRSASVAASGRAMLGFLRNPTLLATYVVGGTVLFTLVGAFTFITYYLAGPPFDLSTQALGYLFATYLVGIFTTVPASRIIDRFGHRWAILMTIGVAVMGLLLTLIPNIVAVAAGLATMAAAVFVCQAASQGFVGHVVSANRSSAAALYFTAYYLAGGLGAVVPAWAWNHAGWSATVELIVAVQVLAAVIAFFGMRVRRGQELPVPATPT